MSESSFDVIVLGAGVAGLTATSWLAGQGITTANIEAQLFGGLIVNVNELDPPPPGDIVSGADYASNLLIEATELGAVSLNGSVTALSRAADRIIVTTDAGQHYARAVLVATGARPKRVGIPGEMALEHRGVAQCADCDGPMYRDQEVVVVGGGDSALQEALVLANFCKRVHIVHRGDAFRAQARFIDAIATRRNIVPLFGCYAEAVLGTDAVRGVRVRTVSNGDTYELPCSGFFAYVGLAPNSEFLPSEIERDANGRIITDTAFQTAMRGVFCAGAVRAGCGGLIYDAIADGKRSAMACAATLR